MSGAEGDPRYLVIDQRDGSVAPCRSRLVSDFAFGDSVNIDGHTDLIARVTGFAWSHGQGHTVHASWLHNGTPQAAYFEDWRLARVLP